MNTRIAGFAVGVVCFGAAVFNSAVAADFLWQPTCDTFWQGCCDLNATTKQNNWGRTSPSPVCPILPAGTDNVTIHSDCVVAPTPAVAAGVLEQTGGVFTLNGNLGIGTSAEFDGPFVWNAAELGRSGGAASQYARMNGGLSIAGDADKTLSFFGGFRLINADAGTWSGNGNWTIGMIPGGCCPSIFENAAGSTFTVQNNASIIQTAFGPGRIENAGLLVKDQSSGVSTWNVSLYNTGTIHIKTGTLRLISAGAIGGTWNADPGAELQIAGNFFTLDPSVTLNGRAVVLDSGTNAGIVVDNPVTIDDLTIASTGNIGGAALLSFRGTLTVEGGIPATPIRILPHAQLVSGGSQRFGPLNIAGTAYLNTGITGSFGAPLTVEPGGVVAINDGAALGNTSNGVQPIHNHGTIRKNASAGVVTINSAFNWMLNNYADGLIDVPGGQMDCFNRIDAAGEIRIAAGATFHQATWSTWHPGATITGDGVFWLDSPNNFIDDGFELVVPRMRIVGTIGGGQGLSGPGNMRITHALELDGGYCQPTTTTIDPTAILTVAGPNFTQGAGYENYGRTNVVAGGMNYHTTFNNHPGAVVDLQGDTPFGGRFGNAIFNNQGLLVKSAGSGDVNITGSLNNAGTIELRAGRLVVTGNFAQSAGTTLVAGGSMYTGTMTLNGGLLTGAGVVNANIVNVGGVVAPGNSAGTLQLIPESGAQGDYSQGANGSLRIEIGGMTPGTQHDQLVVARNAALGGGLNIDLINGFAPQLGDQFVILTAAGTRSGQFAHVSGTQIGSGLKFNVVYNAHDVTLTVVTGGTIPGDLNGDGHVGLGDLTLFLSSFGMCDGQAGFNAAADLNGDGCVAIGDLTILLSNFGA